MSSVNRQNSLLVAEDWKKVYQTFREADFQSYDFETLRKSMIDYLRLYYPEDFNDFIESSEYIALIDLIAFLGQSLAFRTDLNARENFLDTAERRDSVLKLARLISYSPKRSIPSSGLLKISSVASSEQIYDSNGINLSNLSITWNDATNSNWQEQFSLILNAALLNSQTIGKPGNSQVINGVKTDEYTINITSSAIPVFPFDATVGGTSMSFEAVSASSFNQPYVYEKEPRPLGKFNILNRNDNKGNGSINSGYFLYFKQGKLQSVDFSLAESMPNRVLNVGFNNINNIDTWLYDLTATKFEKTLWTKVPAIAGVNVIYNKSVERNLYQINTREGDQIDLVFGDGSFSNVPQGNYRIYFRTSNGSTYKITPDEMQGITIVISYVSRSGNIETLSVRANLNYTVTNANANETTNDIRQKAPQAYYSQGRMITGEDYNIVPFTSFSNILKVKAVNRTSSGVSRFLDVSDTTGKYSSTNIFGQDGYLYKEELLKSLTFSFLSTSSVQQVVQDDLTSILSSKEIMHFYYDKFNRYTLSDCTWNQSSMNTNGSTGYFYGHYTDPITHTTSKQLTQLGYVTGTNARYIRVGAIIRFAATADFINTPKYFNSQNQIMTGYPQYSGDKLYIYSSVLQVIGDGTNGGYGAFANGQGPVTITQQVPSGAIVHQIIPVFKNSFPQELITEIATKILAYNNFGIRYDTRTEQWMTVREEDLGPDNVFSLIEPGELNYVAPWDPGNTSGNNYDASWMFKFVYSNNIGYTIFWRAVDYVFESKAETKFYFDDKVRIYDSSSGTVIQDQIKVLKVNANADSALPLGIDYTWFIYKNIVDIDGYENQNKVLVTFTDTNSDGVPDNPDLFTTVINPTVDPIRKLIFFKKEIGYNSFISFLPIDSSEIAYNSTAYSNGFINKNEVELIKAVYPIGTIFYTLDNNFYMLASDYTLILTTDYLARVGRENLYFQYRHNSPGYRRIDPSPNNIIDLFMLTNSYATDYQNWIHDTTNTLTEPLPPTTEQLKLEYSQLENYKAISDTIIFNSAKFKPLFGAKSAAPLQAIFKVVKNPSLNISDNDIKSGVIGAINTYFDVTNWDFGESFFFSELSAYLHAALSPKVSSVIIVPKDPSSLFGSLYQINAEANEILTSSATVNNVEIISAITAAQINANYAGLNSVVTLGSIQ